MDPLLLIALNELSAKRRQPLPELSALIAAYGEAECRRILDDALELAFERLVIYERASKRDCSPAQVEHYDEVASILIAESSSDDDRADRISTAAAGVTDALRALLLQVDEDEAAAGEIVAECWRAASASISPPPEGGSQ